MEDALLQYGVGGILAVQILKTVLPYFNGRFKNGKDNKLDVDKALQRQRMEHAIDKIADNMEAQTEILRTFGNNLALIKDKMRI